VIFVAGRGVEVLERAVAAIFKSFQLRDVLLYATLLLVFAAVWVCYRWPAFAVAAVVIACVIVGGEAVPAGLDRSQ